MIRPPPTKDRRSLRVGRAFYEEIDGAETADLQNRLDRLELITAPGEPTGGGLAPGDPFVILQETDDEGLRKDVTFAFLIPRRITTSLRAIFRKDKGDGTYGRFKEIESHSFSEAELSAGACERVTERWPPSTNWMLVRLIAEIESDETGVDGKVRNPRRVRDVSTDPDDGLYLTTFAVDAL